MIFIIFLIGFIWITRDIIRVKETFNDSWFAKFKGNQFIDPEVSWANKGNYHMLLYPIMSMVGDLFHLLGTLILLLSYILIKYLTIEWNILLFLFVSFLLHGSGVWLGYQLFRNILNKKT